jgi:hypothetical protein
MSPHGGLVKRSMIVLKREERVREIIDVFVKIKFDMKKWALYQPSIPISLSETSNVITCIYFYFENL